MQTKPPQTPTELPLSIRDSCQTPTSEEEIRLAGVAAQGNSVDITQAKLPCSRRQFRQDWVSRLCSCFLPISRPTVKTAEWLLPPQLSKDFGKPTLVIDLDETLVHSTFHWMEDADFKVKVEINGQTKDVSVKIRPGAQEFLLTLAKRFELVIFTASQRIYAETVINMLDTQKCVTGRLYREHCFGIDGMFVKNLACLGRDLKKVLLVDVRTMAELAQLVLAAAG